MADRTLGFASSCRDLFAGPRCWLALFAVCCGLQRAPAYAQTVVTDPTRDASARALFEEGVRWGEQQQWTEAEDRFRRALTLRASPVIAYNLASVLVTRGKLVEATELLRYVETEDKADLDLKQAAHALETRLSARIARIVIEVRGVQGGDVVALDGSPLHDAQLDVEIPIDPGSHQLLVTRGDQALVARAIEVPPGSVEHVALAVAAEAPGPVPRDLLHGVATSSVESTSSAPRAALAETNQPNTDKPVTSRWWFWTGAGVVAVAAVVIGVAAASGGSQSERAYRGDFAPGSLSVQVAR